MPEPSVNLAPAPASTAPARPEHDLGPPAAVTTTQPEPLAVPEWTRAFARRLEPVFTVAAAWLTCADALGVPGADALLEPQPRRLEPQWSERVERVTFYVNRYAIDLPRALLRPGTNFHIHNLGQGAVGFDVAGNCKVRFWIQGDLFAPMLAEFDAELCGDSAEDGGDPADPDAPRAAGRATPSHHPLVFESDYQLFYTLYTRDFQKLTPAELAQMPPKELLATVVLAGIKPSTLAPGAQYGIYAVQTPQFRGFAYGWFETDPQCTVRLHDQQHWLTLEPVIPARGDVDRGPLLANFGSIVASVRHHGSPTPGHDMLAAARRILADLRYEQDETIARTLVLCATRYDDAFDQAVELGEKLVDPGWSERLNRIYLEVLHRRYPW